MNSLQLADVDIYHFGNSIQIAGIIWSGDDKIFITLLPNKTEDFTELALMPLSLDEWKALIRQTDLLEVQMFSQDSTGLTKTIVRKSQRQIDQRMQWSCFVRDNYTCRYCGRTNTAAQPLPLTVDHIILWEKQGVTVMENLITSCKACNSDRGNMEYADWIKSHRYQNRSKDLPLSIKTLNESIIQQLPYLESLSSKNRRSR